MKLGNPQGTAALIERGNDEAGAAIEAKADATAQRYRNILGIIRKEGVTSARGIAAALNERGVLTPRGK